MSQTKDLRSGKEGVGWLEGKRIRQIRRNRMCIETKPVLQA
jgi:hypothetical protein